MHTWLYGWNMPWEKVPTFQTSHLVKQFAFVSKITVLVILCTFKLTALRLKKFHLASIVASSLIHHCFFGMALSGRCGFVKWCDVLVRMLWYIRISVGKTSRGGYRREKSKRGVGPRCITVGRCRRSTRARRERKQTFLCPGITFVFPLFS